MRFHDKFSLSFLHNLCFNAGVKNTSCGQYGLYVTHVFALVFYVYSNSKTLPNFYSFQLLQLKFYVLQAWIRHRKETKNEEECSKDGNENVLLRYFGINLRKWTLHHKITCHNLSTNIDFDGPSTVTFLKLFA